jgi:nucleoredoxin
MLSLIDSTPTSLTVTWPSTKGATKYILQFRKTDKDDFETLSDSLTTTVARKRNLTDANRAGFLFRAGAITNKNSSEVSDWMTHSEPFYLMSQDDEKNRMAPPKACLAGSNQAVLIKWDSISSATQYELQMRENDGSAQWNTISSTLSGTEVKKKNLKSRLGYQFRVRPAGSDGPFSSPSNTIIALGLSDGIKQLFHGLENGTLLQNEGAKPVPLEDALGGKEFILLYASAHWCGPCRNFTPQLANWYRSLGGTTKSAEVVFLSCDHDENGFNSYYKEMPWLAVPFDDDAREQLLGHIRVQGIPRLVVLDGKTGRILVDNAVGQQMDVNHWRRLAGGKK